MQDQERATFDAEELAIALSYYDLGVIESITEFTRGSRRSPKVGVVCDHGKFVLKRRSMIGGPGRSAIHPDRVRFTHRVQKCLAGSNFPMAGLVPTSDGRYTFVQVRDYLYELFEFVAGHPYQQTASEAGDAGVVLARFHHATEGFSAPPALPAPRGDYHDAPGVRTGLCSIGSTLSSHESFSGDEAELAGLIQFLLEAYDDAAEAVNQAGFAAWHSRIVHSDWHPGNLLFRKQEVVAVIDYDSVRQSRRVIDVANGVLQFSMVAKGDPASWPDHLDEERWHAFVDGYESRFPITDAERGCIPYLMAEALIAECVPPITHTGSVGRWAGFRVLQMVRRKVKWLTLHGERITRVLKG